VERLLTSSPDHNLRKGSSSRLCFPPSQRMLQVMLHHAPSRGLTTLLFTDIAGSTGVVVQLGDGRWKAIQSRHHALVRRQLKQHGGHEVDTAGDGFLATFSSPAAGVRCAFAIVKAVRELGLEIRAGLHIGEAELTGEKVSGIAVTTAARVSAVAGPGQVLVTSTIVQLVAGSGLGFSEVGTRELKGVPGKWELFALTAVDEQPIGEPLDPKDAAEARNRSSPPQAPKRPAVRVLPLGLVGILVAVLAGALLLHRDRPGMTATSRPMPTALVALSDESGEVAFPVDPLPDASTHPGPIVITGRVHTLTAFAWLPWGGCRGGLCVSQINRTSGAVVATFGPTMPTCVCIASAEGRIWYPFATGKPAYGSLPLGVSLRGMGLKGGPDRDIVVDKALAPGGGAVGALVSGDGYLWFADSSTDRVYRINPRTDEVRSFSLRQSADVLVFADGGLWVLDTLGGKITRVDPETGDSGPSYAISGTLQGMAVGGGYVWVTDASGDDIQRIPKDLQSASTPIQVGQIGASPRAVAYDDGAIVVGFGGGTVSKIDPANPSSPMVIWTHPGLGNDASSITLDRGIVWAAGAALSI
jgi:class 3 adenylate cyclase